MLLFYTCVNLEDWNFRTILDRKVGVPLCMGFHEVIQTHTHLYIVVFHFLSLVIFYDMPLFSSLGRAM